ncbi:hypothetical protein BJ138DRAFT_1085310 [Hygrophoropsis aurantiaca]|uniref:Uncharacterized protein n=1 Tax=Hygrophoropsis aurantiaca TaxID=72124 RepID=A0ACB8AE71_9AGAM|nr:hypothetical protein BJ138DRAFT_1085310 [Hygrophoropsis aurantiaca]
MPSVAASQQHHDSVPKKNFKSVLGFGSLSLKDPASFTSKGRASVDSHHHRHTHHQPRQASGRASIDTTRSYQYKRKSRADRSSVTDRSFFGSKSTANSRSGSPQPLDEHTYPSNSLRSMSTLDAAQPRPMRRPPIRVDAQEGPWSVSVAETPHDARSYSIYIKTPTHNLTLTRTATEVVELHAKLGESNPGAKLPKLPIDVASIPAPPVKRKSTFLNTLSRLASPSQSKVARQVSQRQTSASSSVTAIQQTPVTSPSQEISDPFTTLAASSSASSNVNGSGNFANSAITGLASYLTSISNEPALRQARGWKRFVRVRTDDLESVRVERAIKRVRSDLAAHVSPKVPEMSSTNAPSTNVSSSNVSESPEDGDADVEEESINGDAQVKDLSRSDLREEKIKEEEESELTADQADGDMPPTVDAAEVPPTEDVSDVTGDKTSAVPHPIDTDLPKSPEDEDAAALHTPVADGPTSRIPRSHSADPDKASRLSRVYTSSTLQDGTSSATGTGDESSISTTAGRRARKKRSQSTDPNKEPKKSQRKVVIDDFEMMRVLGKGCAGKVLLVKHKTSSDLYALKAITKRHVLAHQELQHTLTEQAVLKRMAAESKDPFVVKLWWSFHDKENLFLVMDFHPGGDLATQLARWGRLGRDRARFYAAEIVEGVEGLHAAGVIYRDLKPENILIGADGHIVLTDFGLSKEFPRRSMTTTAPPTPSGTRGEFYSSAPGGEPATPPWMKGEKGQELAMGWPGQGVGPTDTTSTFCGTAEYLAPEVIQGLPYSYEVDWWSFGTMLYEMLTGITPFWANNHSDMYVRVLQDELQFPDDRAIDQDTKSLIRGLLQRNPSLRMCEPRIKRHPYFSMIDWSHVYYKRYIPPYIPPIDPSNASDTQNFDDTFLDMEPVIDDPNENEQEQTDTDQERDTTDVERTDGEDSNPTPSHSRSPSVHPADDSVDVFDGYSFKGRHSVIIDDEEGSGESERDESEEEDLPAVVLDGLTDSPEAVVESVASEAGTEEDAAEPKTPEARPQVLPDEPSEIEVLSPVPDDIVVEPSAPTESATTPRKETPTPETSTSPTPEVAPPPPAKDTKPKPAKAIPRPTAHRPTRNRREKSGVPALDRFLSDGPDGEEDITEKEDEDDDWAFIEAADGEDRNGTKGTSLFARGVVDRYRLAVFRKASTPSQRPNNGRSFSGMSKESDLNGTDPIDSPTPSDKQRRGRTPGLKFRKTPRQFLRPKSPPPSSFSAKSGSTAKTLAHSNSATLSSASSTGMLTPSLSAASTMPMSPSLKSKESATSVGEQSLSSDQSNGDALHDTSMLSDIVQVQAPGPTVPTEEPEKLKNKKLKKYKENAEKMLSIFASPRQA